MVNDIKKIGDDYISNCTFVKTVLMLCVVLGHSVNFWKGNWFIVVDPIYQSKSLALISDIVNSFHIYAFVIVSGYVYAFLRIQKGKYDSFILFIQNKTKRLLVPFIFICAIWVCPIGAYLYKYSAQECIQKYVLGTSPNQLWFLLMLFWCFVFVWPLTNILKKHTILSFIIVGLFYITGVVGSHFLPNYFSIWTGCEYLLFFWIGFQVFRYRRVFSSIPIVVWLIFYAVIFILERIVNLPSAVTSVLQILVHIVGALMAFFVLQYIASKVKWEKSKLFTLLSENSMPIYLVHQQFIYFLILWLNGKVTPFVNASINFIIAIMLSFIFSRFMLQFKLTRFLIGEK